MSKKYKEFLKTIKDMSPQELLDNYNEFNDDLEYGLKPGYSYETTISCREELKKSILERMTTKEIWLYSLDYLINGFLLN